MATGLVLEVLPKTGDSWPCPGSTTLGEVAAGLVLEVQPLIGSVDPIVLADRILRVDEEMARLPSGSQMPPTLYHILEAIRTAIFFFFCVAAAHGEKIH